MTNYGYSKYNDDETDLLIKKLELDKVDLGTLHILREMFHAAIDITHENGTPEGTRFAYLSTLEDVSKQLVKAFENNPIVEPV